MSIDTKRLRRELQKKNNKDLIIDMYLWIREMNGSVKNNDTRIARNEKLIWGFVSGVVLGFIGFFFWLLQQQFLIYSP